MYPLQQRSVLVVAALTLSVLGGVESSFGSVQYTMIDLGAVLGPNSQSEASSINNTGRVAGTLLTATSMGSHPFSYQSGVLNDLGFSGNARAISDGGQLVGRLAESASTNAFYFDAGLVTDLGTLGGSSSEARGINESGQVVGWSRVDLKSTRERAFLYENGVMHDLGSLGGDESIAFDINESGTIAGQSLTVSGQVHAAIYSSGVWTDLGTLGGPNSQAYANNDSGWVVGVSDVIGGMPRAFLFRDGNMIDLGTHGFAGSDARDVNNSGQVVGRLRTPGTSMAYVNTDGVFTELGLLPTGSFSVAESINDMGWIAGYADVSDNNGERHAVLWIPVPEPVSLSLACIAITLLSSRRRRVI